MRIESADGEELERPLRPSREAMKEKIDNEKLELNGKELKQRLHELAGHDREAVAVFATRCALRVLPFTAKDSAFDHWLSNQREYAQHVFIACVLGLEYQSIHIVDAVNAAISAVQIDDRANVKAAVETTSDLNDPAVMKAVSAATAVAAVSNAARATKIAINPTTEPINAFISATLSAANAADRFSTAGIHLSDFIQLEQGHTLSVKTGPLWLDGLPPHVRRQADSWSKAMSDLKLDNLVQVYWALLEGRSFPKEEIQLLVNDWYKQYGHKYAQEDKADGEPFPDEMSSKSESESESPPKASTKYDQNHASMYDALADRDNLGRQQLVNAMADILAARENAQHQTIGLLGDWGAGKSTFVKLLKTTLEKQSEIRFLFAEFNAWEYEHTDNMQAGVAREALKGLIDDLGWWERLMLTLKFSWQEKPWHVAVTLASTLVLLAGSLWGFSLTGILAQSIAVGGAGGLAALILWKFFHSLHKLFKSPLVNEWKSYLSLPDYDTYLGTIPVMKRQIRALCRLRLGLDKPRAEQRRFLYVVDDLDRCSHSGVVKTLEAVRLIMGIPQVIVIIAIDQRIALASLALHYKELAAYHQERNPGSIARDYLGKVIQLPVQLHAPDQETVAAFVEQVLLNDGEESIQKQTPAVPDHFGDGVRAPDFELASVFDTGEQLEVNAETHNTEAKAPSETLLGKEPFIEKIEYQFSPTEKTAFKKRVKEFKFHNPRQLKRLYNSFNLLRHLYGSDQADDHMLVLFWSEYLNSLSAEKRNAARKEGDIWKQVQAHFENDDKRYEIIEQQVRPFVLPALDNEMSVAEQSEKYAG